ncbi:MAG TPA: hypothetical protein VKM56_13310 [Verrucomicrobiae bacterium]|nr:hypothetical protein [Verrucomicrobiae bacterium]
MRCLRRLICYTNQLGLTNWFGYDAAGRKTSETNANGEITRYTNSAAGDLLALVDGKTNVTLWNFDMFGRATNKIDASGATMFGYNYDANDRLTNRWTPAKTNALYSYDAVGNLTKIDYAVSTDIVMTYDALNRLSTMTDAAGTCSYTYSAFGPLASEDGPWDSDTVTYNYNNALRTALNLAAPNNSPYTQSYNYDSANRLQTISAPEGSYTYAYSGAGPLIAQLTLPNSAFITNQFDSVARLLSTQLKNSGGSILNSHTN